ncbi:MAG TPA: hypothetical protein VIU12_25285, partial [Chryseolinea sp.]
DFIASESNIVFPGFLVVCLRELLECLGHNIAGQAGIGGDDRHHRLNHLLWITPKILIPKEFKIFLDVRSLDEVPAVILPVKGGLGHRLVETGQAPSPGHQVTVEGRVVTSITGYTLCDVVEGLEADLLVVKAEPDGALSKIWIGCIRWFQRDYCWFAKG